jgi:gamma-glutamylcyclotransferase
VSDLLWYFAYGSNMSTAIFVERRGMRPAATTWGWLAGYRLCFALPVGPGERGVGNLIGDPSARICGVLYRITLDEAERLDQTEGVHRGFYNRLAVTVANAAGEAVAAFTYLSEFSSEGRKPSARYMGLLLAGALEHGLPEEYVAELRGFELAHDERPEHERE